MPGGEPAGRDAAGDAEPVGRDEAGVADGFVFISTSAPKRAGPANKSTAMDNQNLGMASYATHCGRFRKTILLRRVPKSGRNSRLTISRPAF